MDKCLKKLFDSTAIYTRAQNLVQRLIKRKKKDFVTGQLEPNIGKPKDLQKTFNLMGQFAISTSNAKICLRW